jgi:hypothetical protein
MEQLPEVTWVDIREESLVYATSEHDTIGRDRDSTSDTRGFLPEGILGCCKAESHPTKSPRPTSTRYKGVIWLRYPRFDEMTDSSGSDCEYSSYEYDD